MGDERVEPRGPRDPVGRRGSPGHAVPAFCQDRHAGVKSSILAASACRPEANRGRALPARDQVVERLERDQVVEGRERDQVVDRPARDQVVERFVRDVMVECRVRDQVVDGRERDQVVDCRVRDQVVERPARDQVVEAVAGRCPPGSPERPENSVDGAEMSSF
jgi:hypothetical protein